MALTWGGKEALGYANMLAEIGMPVEIHMETDASAAIGVAKRSGVGKLRHLHVCFFMVTRTGKAWSHYFTQNSRYR